MAAQERQEEKDTQLVSLRQELLTQNEQLDSCQLRVRTHTGSTVIKLLTHILYISLSLHIKLGLHVCC